MSYSDQRLFAQTRVGADKSDGVGRYVAHSPLKRVFDIGVALAILLAVWPVMLASAVMLYLSDGKQVLKREPIIGQDGVEFELFSFDTEHRGKLGAWCRASGIASLPQLAAVLSGKMSLVGPRPLSLEDFSSFERIIGLYMKARPGMTGPWRVAQDRTLGAIAQARLDRAYIKSGNLTTDIGILIRTPLALMRLI